MSVFRCTFLSILSSVLLTACSGVGFQASQQGSCEEAIQAFGAQSCRVNPDGSRDFDYSVQTGEVDILFVDDDSGSMYAEQEKMANQFPGFLDSLSNFDYQIAITTTDVEGNSAGKDGRFLEFSSGQTMLRNNSRRKDSVHYDNITRFQNTIKRADTLTCPNGSQCPSGDERGIYALNRALERPENRSFFRMGGHLAIVILSDEDERSSGGGAPGSEVNGGPISNSYLSQDLDFPSTFALRTQQLLPANKSVSVHSIIIRPAIGGMVADSACWSQQNNQGPGIKGFYGTQYAQLSLPSSTLLSLGRLVPGTLGSICSANYTQEMGNIADHIRAEDLRLPCAPDKESLQVDFSPAPSVKTDYDVDAANRISFIPALPAGTSVRLRFKCPNF